ncbi:hypothetical protein BDV93DRAFT_554895 [Ceratobasidium sp. AG-I]|nr:hypothetical protein BDV93DRAFT_554895 [Ceratobasidium sp. AG-I]
MSLFTTSLFSQLFGLFSTPSTVPPETPPHEPPPTKIHNVPLDTSIRMPVLPLEIIVDIVIYAAAPLLPPPHEPYDRYFEARKTLWNALNGIASSTKYFRLLLIKRWFYVIVAREAQDWIIFADTNWMSGIQHSVAALPPSIERLEILNAHGPDEHIIKLVSRYCPNLTELRLGRCTMFNNQDCVWWKAHPGDHDAYMADRGIEAYAGAVASLFENVPRLRKLHIGSTIANYILSTTLCDTLIQRAFTTTCIRSL